MKITGIDATKSKEGELIFRTEPPTTGEILEEFANVSLFLTRFFGHWTSENYSIIP
jgi:hypothetical protein